MNTRCRMAGLLDAMMRRQWVLEDPIVIIHEAGACGLAAVPIAEEAGRVGPISMPDSLVVERIRWIRQGRRSECA